MAQSAKAASGTALAAAKSASRESDGRFREAPEGDVLTLAGAAHFSGISDMKTTDWNLSSQRSALFTSFQCFAPCASGVTDNTDHLFRYGLSKDAGKGCKGHRQARN